MSKLVINCETGEETIRELTKAEKDLQKIEDSKTYEFKELEESKATQRQAILDRLGLTADEAKLLLG